MCVQSKQDSIYVSTFISGNTESFNQLIQKYNDKVYGYILSKIKDKDISNDIFQEVCIKVLNILRSGKYKDQGKFLPWLMRVTHNVIIDYFRKETRLQHFNNNFKFDLINSLNDNNEIQDSKYPNFDQSKELKKLTGLLSEDQKEVIEMRFFGGMTFKEISNECGISINTALGRMRYALSNMRKLCHKNKFEFSFQ
jgi:RNA polymerase sigma-70 factor (ECF subfamily)